jgi:hypothetical protein
MCYELNQPSSVACSGHGTCVSPNNGKCSSGCIAMKAYKLQFP